MTDPSPAAPPAGWLLDPADPSLLRWWDGTGWSEFRRPREAPPASPAVAPRPAAAPLLPQPPASPAAAPLPPPPPPPAPPAAAPATAAAPLPPPPPDVAAVGFAHQWDTAVLATLAETSDDERQRRGELFTAIRARVLSTAGPHEEVFATFAVTLHDVDPASGGLGPARGVADLFVTDRRALAVGDSSLPGGAVVEIDLADVLRVTPLRDEGVRVDLGHAPPVLLQSFRAGRHGDDLATLLATLAS